MATKRQAKKKALRDARKQRTESKLYLKDSFEKVKQKEKDANNK